MKKTGFVLLAMALVPCLFAVDGVVLINQSTVLAAGGPPYTISQSGSYRLSGNLTVPDANTTAIFMNNDNITLDLNGFSILGPTVCVGAPVTICTPSGQGNGVDFGSRRNITVVNGTVRGMGNQGIEGGGGGSSGGQVENVHADSNGNHGINLSYGKVTGSTATGNGNAGIFGINSTVTGNTTTANRLFGIGAQYSTVSGNTASRNGSIGIVGTHSTVSGNTTTFNGGGIFSGYGLAMNCPGVLFNNISTDNAGLNLILTGAGCVASLNAAP